MKIFKTISLVLALAFMAMSGHGAFSRTFALSSERVHQTLKTDMANNDILTMRELAE
jgi:hypothetical protein